jgi:hypothetical protein
MLKISFVSSLPENIKIIANITDLKIGNIYIVELTIANYKINTKIREEKNTINKKKIIIFLKSKFAILGVEKYYKLKADQK